MYITTSNAQIPLIMGNMEQIRPLSSNIDIDNITDKMNPSLIYYGNDIWLRKDVSFKNFFVYKEDGTPQTVHYYKNCITDQSNCLTSLYFNGIIEQLNEEDTLKIFSTNTIYSIFGIKVTSDRINFNNITKIVNSSSVSNAFKFYMTKFPITFTSQTFKNNHLIYIDRALGSIPINPKKEILIYPLNAQHYQNIKETVEQTNASTYTLKTFKYSSIFDSIIFRRPLYLFSIDDGVTWKRWNGSTFISIDDWENGYPSYDEFMTIGNTYSTMRGLTDENWDLLLAGKTNCLVLCNSYVPVIEVSHEMAELSTTQYLWWYRRRNRYVCHKVSI